MKVEIRKFEKSDIPKKIEWINDPEVNRFLHYDIPLQYDKTLMWFERNQAREDRYDAVIEADGVPVGLIGLLSIDREKGTAEYYITIGQTGCAGKGVAHRAAVKILDHAFRGLGLKKVTAFTETENVRAQRHFALLGFILETRLKNDAVSHGRPVDRYRYGITASAFFGSDFKTPLYSLGDLLGNRLFIKRDDLLPFSFGGNKARKAALFFEEFDAGGFDCVVTYGSGSSNHCRVVSNLCAQRGAECLIISPQEASEETFNSALMKRFGAKITRVPVSEVRDTIEKTVAELTAAGKKPFFIPGGGHGNIGTHAYKLCYDEIKSYEKSNGLAFDMIFLASGTGTTQAGLVCGQLLYGDEREIIGVSIARKNPYGRDVVVQSVRDYLPACSEEQIQATTHFTDAYTSGGYAALDDDVCRTVDRVMARYGIPLDTTYTGKAFFGMEDYIKKNGVKGKNILFLHTGGTPLFFDHLKGTHRL